MTTWRLIGGRRPGSQGRLQREEQNPWCLEIRGQECAGEHNGRMGLGINSEFCCICFPI